MAGLFRQEALDRASRKIEGDVVLASPLSTRLLSTVAIGTVLCAVSFLACADYSRKVTVSGWVVPEAGVIRLKARQAAVVDRVLVHEGDATPAGTATAELRISADTASGDQGRQAARNLLAAAEASTAEYEASLAKLGVQRRELIGRRQGLSRELEEARARISIVEKRREVAESAVARAKVLHDRGYVAGATVESFEASALGAAQEVSVAREAVIALERQISDIHQEIAGLRAEGAGVEAQRLKDEAARSEKRAAMEGLDRVMVTSAVAGRIVALPVARGQAVNPGDTLAVLVPEGSELMAELYAPSRAAGFVQTGQRVRLMYEAFPFQVFGTALGTVSDVSKTVLSPNEVSLPGATFKEPVFRVRVRLARQTVSAYGREVRIQPGMLVNASIELERRSLLRWLLDPLYAAGRR